jgi:hypothetical protein
MINVPRFLVFSGDDHYPLGGWQDFKGIFEDYVDALVKATEKGDWWHIVDLTSGEIVDSGHR